MIQWFKHLSHLGQMLLDAVLPELCVVCEKPLVNGERFVCLHCLADMPEIEVDNYNDNFIHEVLASTHPVYKAASWMRYRKGSPYTHIILDAKYKGRPALSRWVGRQLALKLWNTDFFGDVDALVPVPLNGFKMIKRGYNQSKELSKGISKVTGIDVIDVLHARRHATQARKDAASRRENTHGVFSVKNPARLSRYSHIILIDDVITTGSTILACADAIRDCNPGIKISVISAAVTEL